MSVSLPAGKANDQQKFRVAQFCVKNGLTTKEAIKCKFEPVRFTANVDGAKVNFSYTDVWYIVMGLVGSAPVAQPQETADIPEC